MTWATERLADIADIERKGIDPTGIVTGTSYLGLEHIESGGRILGSKVVTEGELASTKFRFSDEHILYGKLRPYLAKIALPDFAGICSTDILPVKPGPRIDKRYLAYFLRQPEMVEFASSRSTGANLPRLSPKALAEFQIPLPPLGEQKRIAKILDLADELLRKRQRAIDSLNQIEQAIFHEMFGDPKTNPKGLAIVSLGEIADFYSGNSLPKGEAYSGQKDGYLLLKVSDLTPVEVERLLSACGRSANPLLKPIVQLLLATAARKSELLHARWEHVDFDRAELVIPRAKNGHARRVPLSKAAMAVIEVLPRTTEWLLANPSTGKPFDNIKRAWKTACVAAGLPDLHIHDLRHAAIGAMINNGISLHVAGQVAGHLRTESTARYAFVSDKSLAAAVEAGADNLRLGGGQ